MNTTLKELLIRRVVPRSSRLMTRMASWLPEQVKDYYHYGLLGNLRFPVVIHLEATNACNAKCVMCPREQMTRTIGVMGLEMFKRIVDECARHPEFQEIHLHGYGEALLDKHLVEKVRYAKQRGLKKTYFVTTGSLLTEPVARGLIEAGLDAMKLSVYGASKEVYESIHVDLDYPTVERNITNLFRIRKALGARNPSVTIQFLPQERNLHEREAWRAKWGALLDPSCRDTLDEYQLHNWIDGREYQSLVPIRTKRRISCGLPFVSLQILWNGDITACCYDFDNKLKLGQLGDNGATVEGIWNSRAYEQFRAMHRRGRFEQEPVCDTCDQLRVVS